MDSELITGLGGILAGTIGYYIVNRYLEKKRESLSTKRDQLQCVYGPLEVLMKMNKREFERYFASGTTAEYQLYIEQNVWYPNNKEIRRIIMEKSHLLHEIPEAFLELLTHINVFLTEYDMEYNKKMKNLPVVTGTDVYRYPESIDEFIFGKADNLRRELNIKG